MARRPLRSLLIAPTMPDDAGNGLAMRIGMFLEALCHLGEVEVVVLPISGGAEGESALCRRLGIHPTVIPVAGRADTEFSVLRSLADPQARLDAFRRFGRPSLTAYLSAPVLQDIRGFVAGRDFDIVHVARSYLFPAIDAWPQKHRPPISVDLDEDDVETHRRITTLYALRGDAFTGQWLEAEAAAFGQLVSRWLPDVGTAFVSTEADGEAIAARSSGARPIIVPNAIALPAASVRRPSGCSLLFVGGFGYFPNLDAALWLLEAILPPLRARCNELVSVTLVGRQPPKALKKLSDELGVTMLDAVEDLAPVYARASIAVVPLRAGGGSRIKLLEAAAHRVPAVATAVGAESSGMQDGRDIWIADTPDAIVDACLTIWREPAEAERRVRAARAFVETFRVRDATISTLERHFANEAAASA